MHDILSSGSLVEARGDLWLLTRSQRFDHCTIASLHGRGAANASDRLCVIEPFDRLRPAKGQKLARRRRRAVLRHALVAARTSRPCGGLWIASSAAIDLLAFQLEPALAAINGTSRMLLADAVGLGKTIQASLLLAELTHRGWIERALIVCPAGLRSAWQGELWERFQLRAIILDQQAIADRVARLPAGMNPWSASGITIASIDFIKREEVLAALAAVPIDLLIADEAHHLAAGSDRGAAMATLAARAPWCVLISATPHSGDHAAFEFLTSIGERGGDRVAIFRRNRRDVGLAQRRRVQFLRVRGTAAEHQLFDAIASYSRAIWQGRGRSEHAARLVSMTIARRAASSSGALERTLSRRLALLESSPAGPAPPRLPWDEEDDNDDVDADAVLSVRGLDDAAAECAVLRRLIEWSRRSELDSKVVRLLRMLDRIEEPAIVFTEFRDTLDVICARLSARRRAASIHGGLPTERRREIVDAFNNGECDVLIATDAAGEGLNLHHRCRLVIDFDLPWNPLRLEQRIGRVDRLAQRRVVHAIRLFYAGSVEERVLDCLSLRRNCADAELARATSDADTAAAVFDGKGIAAAELPQLRSSVRVTQSLAEAARLDQKRRARGVRTRAYWASASGPADYVFCHRRTFVNAHGTIVGDDLLAHTTQIESPTRNSIDGCSAQIADAAASTVDACAELAERVARRTRPMLRRIAAIRRQIAVDQRREYQRSLFDGRADAAQAEREHAAARMDAALVRITRALEGPSAHLTRIELVAAWPRDRRR